MSAGTREPDGEPRRRIWRPLFDTIEGRILGLGIALTVACLVSVGFITLWAPELSRAIGGIAFTNIVFGRAVSLSFGYASGYDHAVVISVNMATETILVLLFYPLFVFSLNKLLVFPAIQGFLDHTHLVARLHKDKVHRYGVIGLFAFVWFPFWMTGPMVGCAIGYLIGLKAVTNLSAVLAGTFVAMFAWAYLIHSLYARVATLAPWGPVLLIAIIVAVVVAGYGLNRRRLNGRASNPKEKAKADRAHEGGHS